jgi:hypothetical protein
MPEPNDAALLSVAAAISDGAGIDWPEVEPDDVHDAQVLSELRLLERIASFHRNTDPPARRPC